MSAPILRRLSTIRQAAAEALPRDFGRLVQTLDEIVADLPLRFRERLTTSRITYTMATTRARLNFGETQLVDSSRGAVSLYLPPATKADAGRWAQWITVSSPPVTTSDATTRYVTAYAAPGQTINGDASITTVRQGLHEAYWDGANWWTERRDGPRLHRPGPGTVGLWHLNLTSWEDSSGFGQTLATETGTVRLTNYAGLYMRWLDGSSNIWLSTFSSRLALTGDMTIEALVVRDSSTTLRALISHEANGETSADNRLYRISASNTATAWGSESGSGSDATFSQGILMPVGALCHWTTRRSGDVVQNFINGRAISPTSSALATPTGGSSGRFRIGASPELASSWLGSVASVKVSNRALTNAEIREDFNATLGPLYGEI